ncbi:MAG TPA: HD domain-containing phosphohydrolase [Vicinamibacteria bacterium]|nr:HD domain-containing phosphohydrolase [Vicinamibacteria bacterium]
MTLQSPELSHSPDQPPGPLPEMRFAHPPGSVCHHVLVVDDDNAFARTVADALADSDIEAIPVSLPREAVGLARRQPFAAAVVDLMMPDMDGIELARELRRASPATEVVMLTGHGDMRSAIEGIRNELFDYLQKDSLQSVRLRRSVRAAIARSELRAENRQLVSGLQETSRRLRVLSELSARLASERHFDQLLAVLIGAARELVGAEAVRIVLGERGELGDVTIRAAHGDGEAAVGGHFGPGDGICTQVLDTGVPVLMDVPTDHPSYSSRCDDMGTELSGFVCVPLLRSTLRGALTAAGRARSFSHEDLELLASLARQGAVAMENARAADLSRNFFTHASEMLASLLDAQDVHYQGHSRAVAALTDMVARRLGLPDEERRTLHFAALLHDVGKLRLRPGLLAADGVLSSEDAEQVREHPALGVEILRPVSTWASLAPTIHNHHERWDGKGYPRGLAGSEIPLGGRIVAVAEAFEAMTRGTPYRTARTIDEALAEIEACGGTQFDPTIARLFVEEYRLNREQLAGSGRG